MILWPSVAYAQTLPSADQIAAMSAWWGPTAAVLVVLIIALATIGGYFLHREMSRSAQRERDLIGVLAKDADSRVLGAESQAKLAEAIHALGDQLRDRDRALLDAVERMRRA